MVMHRRLSKPTVALGRTGGERSGRGSETRMSGTCGVIDTVRSAAVGSMEMVGRYGVVGNSRSGVDFDNLLFYIFDLQPTVQVQVHLFLDALGCFAANGRESVTLKWCGSGARVYIPIP